MKRCPTVRQSDGWLQENLVIEIEDADEVGQELFWIPGRGDLVTGGQGDMETRGVDYVEMFSLPPVPPRGVFDVRFGNGSRVAVGESVEILVQAEHYPLNVKFDGNLESEYELIQYSEIGRAHV